MSIRLKHKNKIKSYSLFSERGKLAYGIQEFTVDTEQEVSLLPTRCTVGSTAFVIETSKYYKLTNTKEWKPVVLYPKENGYIEKIIDPIFENNSWETIKWVAQNDDPSKYWNTGDYKMLDFPEFTRGDYLTYRQYNNSTATTYVWSLPKLTRTDSGTSGAYSQGTIEVIDIPKFISKIKSFDINTLFSTTSDKYNAIECLLTCNGEADSTDDKKRILVQIRPVKAINGKTTIVGAFKIVDRVTTSTSKSAIEQIFENYGIDIKLNDNYDNSGYRTRYAFLTVCLGSLTIPARQYPVMWIDSNKDRVISPSEYGKSKVGMTLCLGVTRSCVDACPPYNYTDALKNNIYDLSFFVDNNGEVLQMPYISDDGKRVMSPYICCDSTPVNADENVIYTETWGETKFREVLQQLLDSTEIANMIVPVKKITAYKLFRPNYNYLPVEVTEDKIFLPSEHELNGQRFYYTGSYLDKDTEPSSSITCGIGEESDTYEFFHQGASRFFWNKEFLNDFGVKDINLFTRSKPRQNTDKAIEGSNECCYLKCRGNTFKQAKLQYTNNNIIYEDQYNYDNAEYINYSTDAIGVIDANYFKINFDKFLTNYGSNGNGQYTITAKNDNQELCLSLKFNGEIIDMEWAETWNRPSLNYWFNESFEMDSDSLGDGGSNGPPLPIEETTIVKFTIQGIVNNKIVVDKGTALTIDDNVTSLIETLNEEHGLIEPIGTYNFEITATSEEFGYGIISIFKDGQMLDNGSSITKYPILHLENPTDNFIITGALDITGSVAYEPSAGNVEGYILPMFCM